MSEKLTSVIPDIIDDLRGVYSEVSSDVEFPHMVHEDPTIGRVTLHFFAFTEDNRQVFAVMMPTFSTEAEYTQRYDRAVQNNIFFFGRISQEGSDYRITFEEQAVDDRNRPLFDHFRKIYETVGKKG